MESIGKRHYVPSTSMENETESQKDPVEVIIEALSSGPKGSKELRKLCKIVPKQTYYYTLKKLQKEQRLEYHEAYYEIRFLPPIADESEVKDLLDRIKKGNANSRQWAEELEHLSASKRIAPLPGVLKSLTELVNQPSITSVVFKILINALVREFLVDPGKRWKWIFPELKERTRRFILDESVPLSDRLPGIQFWGEGWRVDLSCEELLRPLFHIIEIAPPNENLDRTIEGIISQYNAAFGKKCKIPIKEKLFQLQQAGVRPERVGRLLNAIRSVNNI